MAKAKNAVIAGDYMGCKVDVQADYIALNGTGMHCAISKDTVEGYELITDEVRKSAASGIARGIVGGVLLGPVGLLAAVTAKSKGIYQLALQFRDGKRALVEVDDKRYKLMMKKLF